MSLRGRTFHVATARKPVRRADPKRLLPAAAHFPSHTITLFAIRGPAHPRPPLTPCRSQVAKASSTSTRRAGVLPKCPCQTRVMDSSPGTASTTKAHHHSRGMASHPYRTAHLEVR